MLEYSADGRQRRAAIWVPERFDESRSWPLLVFLHAYEERGDDFEHLATGIGPALDQHPELYPCLVLLPQCPADLVWSPISRPWAEGFGSAAEHVDAAIHAALDEFPIARHRIALTGASMGGFGTFVLPATSAHRFSALGPVCGGGDPEQAAALKDTPLWAFHGSADTIVPVAESRAMVEAIRSHGGRGPLRYTEVPEADHHIWDTAYADPEFVGFLLRDRSTPSTP